MNIAQIYKGMSPFLRDRFTSEVFTLGLIHELNQSKYEAQCRRLIKQHNGSSRVLYKAMMKLDLAQRKRFFDVISGVLDHELTNQRITADRRAGSTELCGDNSTTH